MTFIQPNEKQFIHIVLFALIVVLISGSFSLIFLYNHSVNLGHEIANSQAALRKLQAGKAELQDKIFALSSDASIQKFSESRNLVKDKTPQYFETGGNATTQPALAGLAGR